MELLDQLDTDPFEAFNRAMGVGIVTDPYADFVELRKQGIAPAHLDLSAVAGEIPPLFTVASYDAVLEVLRDGQRFSSTGYAEVMGKVLGHSILEMDEPEHHGYRSLIQQAFTRKAMERWEEEVVGTVVDDLIDAFAADGRAELVSQLLFPFPVNVIAALLGVPKEDLTLFHRLAVGVISVSVDMDLATKASRLIGEYMLPMIHERRANPGDDLISVLATADHEGQFLTDDEILAFCRLLMPAGAETTYRSSSNLVCGLLQSPEQLLAVREDRSLLTPAMEEGLRWEPPLLMIMRTVTEDTEVCGVALPKGAVLMVNMGAANHDETRWDDPEVFDIHREQKAHIAFASGTHMCLGMHLARMETRVAVNRLLDRFPDLRLDPDAEPPVISGMTFRAPLRLDVVF